MKEENWGEKYWWAICLMVLGAMIWSLFWYWLHKKYRKANNHKKAKISYVISFIPWIWVLFILLVFDPISFLIPDGKKNKKNNENNNEDENMKNLKSKSWIKRLFWDKK